MPNELLVLRRQVKELFKYYAGLMSTIVHSVLIIKGRPAMKSLGTSAIIIRRLCSYLLQASNKGSLWRLDAEGMGILHLPTCSSPPVDIGPVCAWEISEGRVHHVLTQHCRCKHLKMNPLHHIRPAR